MSDAPSAADVEALVAAFQASDCSELHVRFPGFELHLATDAAAGDAPAAPPAMVSTAPPPAQREAPKTATPAVTAASPKDVPPPPPSEAELASFEIVRAPYLGVFYRAPKPGDPPYVELGQAVQAESDLCLVEVMKLFTAVRAGVAGTVAKVLAADGAMVEAGQPLFAIAPEA